MCEEASKRLMAKARISLTRKLDVRSARMVGLGDPIRVRLKVAGSKMTHATRRSGSHSGRRSLVAGHGDGLTRGGEVALHVATASPFVTGTLTGSVVVDAIVAIVEFSLLDFDLSDFARSVFRC